MLRGKTEEILARAKYAETYAPVEDCGFITNNEWGFTIGCSPDGLVGKDGMIECKSRCQKYQIQTVIENVTTDTMPEEYALQVQTALLVSGRLWCDFVSYSGGLPMATIRVLPDPVIQDAIIKAATAFEARLAEKWDVYRQVLDGRARLIETERTIEEEMF
jgi:predicted phage-related endonuclease